MLPPTGFRDHYLFRDCGNGAESGHLHPFGILCSQCTGVQRYSAETMQVSLTVLPVPSPVNWPQPADIAAGTALGD
jgi:hypothetical protein